MSPSKRLSLDQDVETCYVKSLKPYALDGRQSLEVSVDRHYQGRKCESVPLLVEGADFEKTSGSHNDALPEYKKHLVLLRTRWLKLRHITIHILGLMAVACTMLLFFMSESLRHPPAQKYWHGFSRIDRVFAFGDSWTDTGFAPWDLQPSPANPIGNPPFPGRTSSHGLNYIECLTTQYNESIIELFTLAISGATVDNSIVPSFLPWGDLKHQVDERFLDFYVANASLPKNIQTASDWTSEQTLFSFFFGLNDLAAGPDGDQPFRDIFNSYEEMLGKLYDAGARNILLINLPPIHLAPRMQQHLKLVEATSRKVAVFNRKLTALAKRLRTKHLDITVFEYDFDKLFKSVIQDPTQYPQTRGYINITDCCSEYAFLETGQSPTPEQISQCGGLPHEYLWLNSFHVTWPLHDAMAHEIATILSNEPSI